MVYKPNQAQMSVVYFGVGKSTVAYKYLFRGLIGVSVTQNPAMSISQWQTETFHGSKLYDSYLPTQGSLSSVTVLLTDFVLHSTSTSTLSGVGVTSNR